MAHHVITIAQQKGGAGKTTVAAHLAVVFAQQNKRVAVLDIDPQASLTQWHQERANRFGEEFTGLNFQTVSGWRVQNAINALKEDHDIIIIDSPPHTDTDAKVAIRAANLVVIPVQPSPTDLWATQATIDLAEREQVNVCVLLNRVSPNAKLAATISRKLQHLLKSTLGNRVAFAASIMEGRCVTETAPSSAAAQEVKALAQEVGKKLGIKIKAKKALETA